MISALLAVAVAFAPPITAGTTSSVPMAQPVAPLREIVYDFSYSKSVEHTNETFDSGLSSATSKGSYSGRVTVDVLKVDPSNGSILIACSESTNADNQKAATSANFVIKADGSVGAAGGSYDENMTPLLPYLATAYFGDHLLQEGAAWQSHMTAQDVQTTTKYNVSKVDGDVATISSVETQSGGSVRSVLTTESKIIYKAPLLVPLMVDVQVYTVGSSFGVDQSARTVYHFDRTSDSRDTGAARK
jgi:hypothetical protein